MTEGRPLSAGQQALWFVHRMAPDSAAYNVVLAVRVLTALDTGRLQAAARALAIRHDMIRSSFTEVGGEPRRLLSDPDVIRVEIAEAGGQDLTHERIAAACRRPFRLAAVSTSDLELGPGQIRGRGPTWGTG